MEVGFVESDLRRSLLLRSSEYQATFSSTDSSIYTLLEKSNVPDCIVFTVSFITNLTMHYFLHLPMKHSYHSLQSNFHGANLSKADLRRTDLRHTSLTAANLTGANLTGANLCGAYLSRADLSRANFTNADSQRAIVKKS